MKVNDPSLNQAATSHLGRAHAPEALPADPAKPDTGPRSSDPDRVQLSELPGRLMRLLSADSPERAARLERLAAEVRAGTYRVDALAVSRRLIDEAFKAE